MRRKYLTTRYHYNEVKQALRNKDLKALTYMRGNLALETDVLVRRCFSEEQLQLLDSMPGGISRYTWVDKLLNAVPGVLGALALTPGIPGLTNAILSVIGAAPLPKLWWIPGIFLTITFTLASINAYIQQSLVTEEQDERRVRETLLTLKRCILEVVVEKLQAFENHETLVVKARDILILLSQFYPKLFSITSEELEDLKNLTVYQLVEKIKNDLELFIQKVLPEVSQNKTNWHRLQNFVLEKPAENESATRRKEQKQNAPFLSARPLTEVLERLTSNPLSKAKEDPAYKIGETRAGIKNIFKKWYSRVVSALGVGLGVGSISVLFMDYGPAWLPLVSIITFVAAVTINLWTSRVAEQRARDRKASVDELKIDIETTEKLLDRELNRRLAHVNSSPDITPFPQQTYQAAMEWLTKVESNITNALDSLSEPDKEKIIMGEKPIR